VTSVFVANVSHMWLLEITGFCQSNVCLHPCSLETRKCQRCGQCVFFFFFCILRSVNPNNVMAFTNLREFVSNRIFVCVH
jgi:hypothetical protein